MSQSFKNQFLVSLSGLKGDYFQNTLSLLVDHDENGAFGFIINRPIDRKINSLFVEIENDFECPVLLGGPVEQNRVFFLHPSGHNFDATIEISSEIALTTSPDIIKAMQSGKAPKKLLAIMGYAGWAAEQLEDELAENIWLLAPCSANIVFDVAFEKRTLEAAKQLGIDLNLMPTVAGHD